MRNAKLLMGVVAPALAIIAPAGAAAPGVDASGQLSIGVVGFVPVVCRASLETNAVAPRVGTANLGKLNEFCNSAAGYRVVASYSPSLAGGKLTVDGNVIDLTASGSAVVSQSDHAGIESRKVTLDLPRGATDGSISFRIEPR